MPETDVSRAAVAIAGCGAITAVGSGLEALRAALRSNRSGLQPSARFDSPRFQSSVVGSALANDSAPNSDDPALQLATEALLQAREQARAELASIPSDRIGLVLSTTKANIEALERLAEGRPCSDT